MSSEDPRTPLHPSLALAAYAGGLLSGRRAAVLGDSASGLAEHVASLTGRRVHAYDAVRDRVAAAIANSQHRHAQVSFAPLDEATDAHEGAFDAVIVSEMWRREAGRQLDLARQLLSPRGIVIVASLNPDRAANEVQDVLGYYELYDALSDRFAHVQMLGQAPFVGFTVAEFALEGEPTVTIDTSLVTRTEEPRYYVAVASDHGVASLDPYTLVQMPLDGIAPALLGSGVTTTEPSAELAEARVQISVLEAELDKAQDASREAREFAKERQAAATVMSARLAELQAAAEEQRGKLQREVDRMQDELAALERETTEARTKSGRAQDDIDAAEARAERAERNIAQVRDAQDRAEKKARELEQRLSALRREQGRIERDRDEARARVDELEERLQDAPDAEDLERKLRGDLERKLRGDLERQLRRDLEPQLREEIERQLRKELEADMQERLAEAEEAQQADLDAMLERIGELEAELESRPEVEAPTEEEAPATTLDARGLQFQMEELRLALNDTRADNDAQRRELEALRTQRDELKVELRRAATTVGAADADMTADLDALEARLKEQGQRLTRLQGELRESERFGRELLRRVGGELPTGYGSRGGGSGPTGEGALQTTNASAASSDELDGLRQRAARCEADLQAAQWTITSLRNQVSQADVSAPPTDRLLEEALRAARAEVAQLRRALAEGGQSA